MSTEDKNIQIRPSKKKGENKASITLKNELTIFSIENMYKKIKDAFNKYDEIEFNLTDVSNMDLTFVQFFFSLRITAEKLKKQVSFNTKLPEDVKSLFVNSDLYKVLN